MLGKTLLTLRKSSPLSGMLLAIMINGLATTEARALTGEDILTKMETNGQVSYVSGILEGLGYARFLRDRPDKTGLVCINHWLIDDGMARWQIVKQWLEQHKEKSAAVIIYAMVSKDCGK
ncbi:MAG: hypothetical protein AAF478_10775 [Pseudomonadota bacterium]